MSDIHRAVHAPRWAAPSVAESLAYAESARMAGPSGDQYAITLADEVERLRAVARSAADQFDAHGLARRGDAIRRRIIPPDSGDARTMPSEGTVRKP